MAEGYEAEPHEVDAVWEALIGEREVDDAIEWWTHLSARLALLDEVERRVHDERARIVERWHRVDGDSFAIIGARIGLTRARVQQLVERGRRLN
jgi:hypothetical protein